MKVILEIVGAVDSLLSMLFFGLLTNLKHSAKMDFFNAKHIDKEFNGNGWWLIYYYIHPMGIICAVLN
jgi:hypothetical protein